MSAPLNSVPSDPQIPAKAEVVVIGGGIVGVSTAYYLAKEGVTVALLEKGRVGAEQSSRNWGWCRQMNRDARDLHIATRSLALWDQLSKDLHDDIGFRRCGLLYLSNDDADLQAWSKWGQWAKGEGVHTDMLTSAQATERGAATGRVWKGGVISPTDGVANPAAAAPAIAAGARRLGATIHQFCAALGVERAGGHISAVVTEQGRIETSRVVVAGGAWSSSFCRQLGVSFPQVSVRSSILSITNVPDHLPDALYTSDVALTRRADGGCTLAISGLAKLDPTVQSLRYARQFLPMFAQRRGSLRLGGLQGLTLGHEARWTLNKFKHPPMQRTRILDPRPDQDVIDETLRRARMLFPDLAGSTLQDAWAGYIDSTPDGLPVIDEVAPGLIVSSGMSGHGFGVGPGYGELSAALAMGRTPDLPYKQFSIDRLLRGKPKVAGF